jgi:hypothetical protein
MKTFPCHAFAIRFEIFNPPKIRWAKATVGRGSRYPKARVASPLAGVKRQVRPECLYLSSCTLK